MEKAPGFLRHCEERLVRRSSTSEGGSDEAIHSFFARRNGLLRGACHWAALRADPLARNDSLMLRSSKPLTEKFRALQPISPGQLDCPGDADPQPGADIRFARAGMQRDRGGIERQAVMLIANPKRFRQPTRTG